MEAVVRKNRRPTRGLLMLVLAAAAPVLKQVCFDIGFNNPAPETFGRWKVPHWVAEVPLPLGDTPHNGAAIVLRWVREAGTWRLWCDGPPAEHCPCTPFAVVDCGAESR